MQPCPHDAPRLPLPAKGLSFSPAQMTQWAKSWWGGRAHQASLDATVARYEDAYDWQQDEQSFAQLVRDPEAEKLFKCAITLERLGLVEFYTGGHCQLAPSAFLKQHIGRWFVAEMFLLAEDSVELQTENQLLDRAINNGRRQSDSWMVNKEI